MGREEIFDALRCRSPPSLPDTVDGASCIQQDNKSQQFLVETVIFFMFLHVSPPICLVKVPKFPKNFLMVAMNQMGQFEILRLKSGRLSMYHTLE